MKKQMIKFAMDRLERAQNKDNLLKLVSQGIGTSSFTLS
jgi:hypothetical protein